MSATISLADRRLPLPVSAWQARDVADAWITHQAGRGDRQFRIPRPAPSPNARRVVTVFSASQVTAVDVGGVNLIDQTEAVAA